MRVTVILIVIGTLITVTKELVQGLDDLEIRGRMKNIQTTASLTSASILRRVLETYCHSDAGEKRSAKAGVKKNLK